MFLKINQLSYFTVCSVLLMSVSEVRRSISQTSFTDNEVMQQGE